MKSIFDLTLNELEDILEKEGFKKYNATQVFEGIYKRKVSSFEDISNISKSLKEYLEKNFEIKYLKVIDILKSETANKYLLEVNDSTVEVVLMHQSYGESICISSQIGCNMACKFCQSGKLKMKRNLSVSEMVLEVLTIEKIENIRVNNIVVMGIGEPFNNYENLVKALNIFTCNKGMDKGSRRITVSTCGIVPKIYEFADLDLDINLAISLHASNQKLREELMPIAKAYKLDELIKAIDYYIKKTNRRVTLEYILLNNINDSLDNAKELVNLFKGKLVYINIIPYNETDSEFRRSSKDKISKFFDYLTKNGINVQKRREMGSNIKGACGQLKASYERGEENV